MTLRLDTRTRLTLLAAAFALSCLSSPAFSSDLPKRKSGLWEIKMTQEGMPGMGPIQQCIDQNTDNLMQQKARDNKQECSVMDTKTTGNKVVVHAVCKIEGSTATTDAVFEGAFDSAYKGTMKTRFNPPMHGMSQSTMMLDARWLGACKPGQKPGDVIMPGMGNMSEMMKDPKFQEMMRRQQQQGE